MDKDQCKEIVENLVAFVKRVSADKKASPAEIAALPEIVRVLCEMTSHFAR